MASFRLSTLRGTILVSLLALSLSQSAHASVVVNIVQSGANVVATGSGTLNLSALSPDGATNVASFVASQSGGIMLGSSTPGLQALYSAIAGPASFGTGSVFSASSGTGGFVGVNATGGILLVPFGYVSGTSLSSSATWNNTTLAGLGLTTGTYTYTWGSGATADSFVLNVATTTPSPTPAPGTLYLAILGILGVALFQFLRTRRTA
jgi:hypothetical protein